MRRVMKIKPFMRKDQSLVIVDTEEHAHMFIDRLSDELQKTYHIHISIDYGKLCLDTKYTRLVYRWSRKPLEGFETSSYNIIFDTRDQDVKDAWKYPLAYTLNAHGMDKVPEIMLKTFTCPCSQPTETMESWLEKYCMEHFSYVDEKITKIAAERGVSYEEAAYIWKNAVDISSRAVGISFDKAIDIYLLGLTNIIGNNE